VLIVIVFFLESLFEYVSLYLFNTLAQKIQHDLRTTAFSKLQRRELAYFESERSGNVVASLTEDVNQTERFLRESLNEMSQYVTLIVFACVVLFSENAIIAVIALGAIPVVIGFATFFEIFAHSIRTHTHTHTHTNIVYHCRINFLSEIHCKVLYSGARGQRSTGVAHQRRDRRHSSREIVLVGGVRERSCQRCIRALQESKLLCCCMVFSICSKHSVLLVCLCL
jgi:ABC-type multidrug transport system fused ATPase/permease subunit